MTYGVNDPGKSNAAALIRAGKISEGAWSFDAADGDKILGDDDWSEYERWFLAIDSDAEEDTKGRFHFPFGKNGEIYRRGVIAAKSRAAQNGYAEIEGAAEGLLKAIDKKLGKNSDKKGSKRGTEMDIVLRRDMPALTAKTFDPKTREADAVISTGVKVRRSTWDGEFDEKLDITPSAIRLERLNTGLQLIDNHAWYGGLDSIVGAVVPGSARIEGGKLLARFKFSSGAKGDRVARDLGAGLPMLLSAGYKVHKFEEDGTTSPPTRNVKDWEPMEVSIVGVSAEGSGTGFRGQNVMNDEQEAFRARLQEEEELARRAKSETDIQDEDEDEEDDDDTKDDGGDKEGKKKRDKRAAKPASKDVSGSDGGDDKSDDDEDDKKPTRKKGLPKPKERSKRSTDANAADIIAIGRRAKMPLEDIETAIREGIDVESFRTRAFEFLTDPARDMGPRHTANGSQTLRFDGGFQPPEPGMQPLTPRGDAMVEALTTRILASGRQTRPPTPEEMAWMERAKALGITDEVERSRRVWRGNEQPKLQETRAWLGRSFVEIAAECIGWRGRGLITQAVAGDIVTRAMMSTSDFPGIFANVLNKTLLARYQLAAPTYRELAIERPFNDFRPHPQVRAGDFPLPLPLTETGEIRAGNSLDSSETASVVPYGVTFNISRQMIVNDELGAIDQILGSAGMAVMVFENTTFFTMFNANPTLLQDSVAVFAAGHNNLVASGSGAVPSIGTIGSARAAMRAQRSLSGYFLNIPPRIILTGPTQETVADQMVTAITPTLTTAVNPFSGRLRSVSDANISDTSWYLAAEAAQLPCFVYGFLSGFTGPRVRTEEPFGIQGIRVSLEHDFGVGAIDFRGFFKNAGS
jgi:hypothetical protein